MESAYLAWEVKLNGLDTDVLWALVHFVRRVCSSSAARVLSKGWSRARGLRLRFAVKNNRLVGYQRVN